MSYIKYDRVFRHFSLIRTEKGVAFQDLNKNGRWDIYEDFQQPLEARVNHLPKQMVLV